MKNKKVRPIILSQCKYTMAKTARARKGPTPSATKYSIGTKKLGNDRHMWKIVTNKNGTKRWARVTSVSKKTAKCQNQKRISNM